MTLEHFTKTFSPLMSDLEHLTKTFGPTMAAQCYAQKTDATFEDFKTLKHLGADFNQLNEANLVLKNSALILAVVYNYLENVEHMLNLGADVNTASDQIGSPLKIAVVKGNQDMVKLLINFGADVNAVHYDESVLMKAVVAIRFDIVKMLVEAGADIVGGSMYAVNRDGSKTMVNALSYAQNIYKNNQGQNAWNIYMGFRGHNEVTDILNYLESVVKAKEESEMLEELLIIKEVVDSSETKSDRKRL